MPPPILVFPLIAYVMQIIDYLHSAFTSEAPSCFSFKWFYSTRLSTYNWKLGEKKCSVCRSACFLACFSPPCLSPTCARRLARKPATCGKYLKQLIALWRCSSWVVFSTRLKSTCLELQQPAVRRCCRCGHAGRTWAIPCCIVNMRERPRSRVTSFCRRSEAIILLTRGSEVTLIGIFPLSLSDAVSYFCISLLKIPQIIHQNHF